MPGFRSSYRYRVNNLPLGIHVREVRLMVVTDNEALEFQVIRKLLELDGSDS